MKRLLILALICLAFVACSKKQEAESKPEPVKSSTETAKVEEVKPEPVAVEESANDDQEVGAKAMKPISQKPESGTPSNDTKDIVSAEETTDTVAETVAETAVETAVETDGEMTTAELWDAYKTAKDRLKVAQEEDDYPNIEKHLLETADYSGKLGRVDIEAWQYNNLGYNLIESFKSKTKYMSATGKLNSMVAGKDRNQYRAEIKGKFLQHKDILLRAEKYLKTAEELDGTLEESSRTTTIESNQMFIKQVLGFIS